MTLEIKRFFLNAAILVLFVVLGPVLQAQGAEPPVMKILQQVSQAEDRVHYAGKRLMIRTGPNGCWVAEELVIHHPPSVHVTKSLMSPEDFQPSEERRARFSEDGERRERRNKEEPEKRPENGSRKMRQRQHRPPPPHPIQQETLELLIQNYDAQVSESIDTIAGYPTRKLTITPQFEGRFTQRLWFSEENGLLLRFEELDAQQKILNLWVYTQISFEPGAIQRMRASIEVEPALDPPEKFMEPISLTEAAKLLDQSPVQPTMLPQGFQLQDTMLMKFGSEPSIHLLYTDGLMSISLFEAKNVSFEREREGKNPERGGPDRWGPPPMEQIHGVSVQIFDRRHVRIFRWHQGELGLTLIGNLSRTEMLPVIESLILSRKP